MQCYFIIILMYIDMAIFEILNLAISSLFFKISKPKPIVVAKSCGIMRAGEKMDKQILIDNIELVHTTEMGIDRIKRNLKLDTNDVVEYCKQKVLDKNCKIYRQGKNWYCEIEDMVITINAYSYTIITAHKIK